MSGDPTGVTESWARLERWFARNLPDRALRLRPPATEAALDAAEEALGLPLPPDLRASYLVHDGQEDEGYDVLWLPYAERLGALSAIVAHHLDERAFQGGEIDEERLGWLDPAGCVRQVLWHPERLVVAGSPRWDYDQLLLDFVPGPHGTAGQLVARADADLFRLCGGLGDLLRQLADGLEGGRIVPGAPMPEASGWLPMRTLSPRKSREIPPRDLFR